jgi:electron-transferring-flavoprotein dehydrogenase
MSDVQNRESIEVDVVIIGAGPAGLATAIRLKDQAKVANKEINIIVLEKGSEVGAHILSGAVVDPIGLNQLLPNWKELSPPVMTPVIDDRFYLLGPAGGLRIPNIFLPRLMSNHNCYATSLSNVVKWLGSIAESKGVDIYPGFPASEVIYEDDVVKGVVTGDFGISKDGNAKESHMQGMEIRAKYTIFAEGARGHLAKEVIGKFNLDSNSDYQKYGLGIKELWEIPAKYHKPGLVQHTMGWPLDNKTGGGSFMYHFDKNLVSIGFVLHLNYSNPTISPFEEFQKFKTHPLIKDYLRDGKRISYGARVISEGGYQSVPKLTFPGGLLVGCSAGFVNVPRIKGSHNAILSGMIAADEIFKNFISNNEDEEVYGYQEEYSKSSIAKELAKVRNVKPLWSRFGTVIGVMLGGIDMWMRDIGVGLPFTLSHKTSDHESLKSIDQVKKIEYPKPDGIFSFDKLSSVYLSSTNHEEDQPVHLRVANMDLQISSEYKNYGGPSHNYCPAGVYEWILKEGVATLQINAQNCVHCKTCDIKDPNQNIQWKAPEGGGGPNYSNM